MNDKGRKEFIEAFVKQFGFGRMAASSNPDAAGMLACAEWAWFASRASLAVQLPEKVEYADAEGEYAKGYRQGMRAVVDQVEAAGLKVKT